MSLPLPFLVGLLVLFANRELWPPVPGSSSVELVLVALLLLPLPTMAALAARRRLWRRLVHGGRRGPGARAWLRLSALGSPLVVHLFVGPGGWLDLAGQLAGDSEFALLLLLLAPLLLVEVPRAVAGTVAGVWAEIDDELGGVQLVPAHALPTLAEVWPIARLRLGWVLLLAVPCAALGAVLDLLQLHRPSYALFLGTTPGATAGTLLLMTLAAAVLPAWFRRAFGARADLPEPTGAVLRETARRLGFPPHRVLQLPTGMRAMNAMLVGPLPIGRSLCLTDGLLRALDADSLTGVVAHEVGHARMGHPGILLLLAAVTPLLAMAPLRHFDLDALDPLWQATLALTLVGAVWTLVRTFAHRFEHEADVASVEALGAAPCTRALLVVSRMAVPVAHGWLGRLLSLHPEEHHRCAVMQRYELDPEFRARFRRLGRWLRGAVVAGVALALGGAVLAWRSDWPYEQAIWRLHCGDVAAAQRLAAALGDDVPAHWRSTWRDFRAELDAAVALAPAATDWATAAPVFAAAGWPQGLAVLRQKGPAAARPWLALALAAEPAPTVVQLAIYEFCRAAAGGDPERMERARWVVRRRGVPEGLAMVFAD